MKRTKTLSGNRLCCRVSPVFFFTVLCLLVNAALCAKGKTHETEKTILNNEWLLCISGFDTSALPQDRQSVALVITKSLVDTLKVIAHRVRISPEYAYYENYAWSQQRSAAARALAAKQDERSLLLYRGDANWRYRQNIKKIDDEITKLWQEMEKKESEIPLINDEPAFGLVPSNKDGNFPEAPKAGGEYRFCQSQKADGFLSGSIRDFHGRYYITLRLYAVYTRSVIYEDSIIFSGDDLADAVDEIAGRLIAALAGSKPAVVAIHADPPETLVLINQTFAGRGELEAREYPPGKINVSFSAPDYQSETVETELAAGELTSISVSLRPAEYGYVHILAPEFEDAKIYQGALFVGKAPFTIRLPLNQFDYLNVESAGGEAAKMAFYTPSASENPYTFTMKMKIPPSTGQRRVNNARKWYYWAWGGTWITGIAAWVSYGMFTTSNTSIMYYNTTSGTVDEQFMKDNMAMYYISLGAVIAVGVAVAYDIFQMTRYIYIATEDNTPVVRHDKTGIVKQF